MSSANLHSSKIDLPGDNRNDLNPDTTMIASAYTSALGDQAICHRNATLPDHDGVFISTRLLSDRFALAFEFFINIGHAFVDSAGVPETFTDLAWSQAVADVRGETSQDAWESRGFALSPPPPTANPASTKKPRPSTSRPPSPTPSPSTCSRSPSTSTTPSCASASTRCSPRKPSPNASGWQPNSSRQTPATSSPSATEDAHNFRSSPCRLAIRSVVATGDAHNFHGSPCRLADPQPWSLPETRITSMVHPVGSQIRSRGRYRRRA